MKSRWPAILLTAAIIAIGVLAVRFWRHPTTLDSRPAQTPETQGSGDDDARLGPKKTAQPNDDSTSPKPSPADSPKALAEFIRQFATTGADPNALYRKLASLELKKRPWWRNAEEVSELLDLAADPSLAEQYRVVVMGLYLAAARQDQITGKADAIQQVAMGAGDRMASAVLQGMADRSVAPAALTKEVLTSDTRGTGAKCYAWYAARLTQKDDPELARIAITASESGMTEASKVAFDYLANGSFASQYAANPQFQQKADALLAAIQSLPAESGPMVLANGDAFIRAVPSITPTETAIDYLFSLLQEAQHPEMRLSAIEQLVSIHLSGAQDLSQELHEVRNQIAALFSDPVKQDRAKIRLNRLHAQKKSK